MPCSISSAAGQRLRVQIDDAAGQALLPLLDRGVGFAATIQISSEKQVEVALARRILAQETPLDFRNVERGLPFLLQIGDEQVRQPHQFGARVKLGVVPKPSRRLR